MNILQIIAAVFFLTTLFSCNNNSKQEVETMPPNILFIFTDDHAKNAMSLYNNKLIQTPNIDRIGKEGIVFNRAYVTNSLCGPSRATILTGKYSHLNGFKQNGDRFDGSQQTFTKLLRKAGYQTAVIGKWHLGSAPTGFDYSNILIGQGHYYNPVLVENGDTAQHIGHATDIVTDLSLSYMDSLNKDRPFCMMVQYKAPHRNWMPHARYFDHFEKDLPIPGTFYDDYASRSGAARDADMRIADMFMSLDIKLYPEIYGEDHASGGMEKHDPSKNWQSNLARLTSEQKADWDAHYMPVYEYYEKNKNKWSEKELTEWKYQRYIKDYLRCVKSVDDNVGRIYRYLEENDLLKIRW